MESQMQQLKVEIEEKEDRIQKLESNNFNLDSFLAKIQDLSDKVAILENLCPIGDPNYALINDKCYYFELRTMNFTKGTIHKPRGQKLTLNQPKIDLRSTSNQN